MHILCYLDYNISGPSLTLSFWLWYLISYCQSGRLSLTKMSQSYIGAAKHWGKLESNPKSKGAFRLDAKQPKFDVIDSSRKVATARNLREQLRNIACLQAVVR